MINRFSSYENDFQQWVRGGYPDAKPETIDYIQHLSDPEDDTRPREGTLWPHQWDSFLRVIYAYEIRNDELALPDGVLLERGDGRGQDGHNRRAHRLATHSPRRAEVRDALSRTSSCATGWKRTFRTARCSRTATSYRKVLS